VAEDPRRWTLPAGALAAAFGGGPLGAAVEPLHAALRRRAPVLLHGDLPHWRAALADLALSAPVHEPHLDGSTAVVAGSGGGPVPPDRARVRDLLARLAPWRKGPFRLDGVDIDAEWRSDLKWDRLLPHIAPLHGRCVLDVGSGSGYHLWRMHAAGAAAVLGIEPMLLFDSQFRAVARYAPHAPVKQLPLRLEDLSPDLPGGVFDTVFSMGVLYHAQDPHDHLGRLRALLRPGGQLVLETLVVERPGDEVLSLPGRYAGMRNIDRLPSPSRLHRWLAEAGLQGARTVSLARTSHEEQRVTAWSGERSLGDALAPDDVTRTREGHPAPYRATVLCERHRVPA